MPERQVFLNQMIKIGLGLEGKEMVQEAVVERIQLEGRGNLIEGAQVEPLVAEGMDHAFIFFILQHPIDLRFESVAIELISC